MVKITLNVRNKGIKTTWMRKYILFCFLFISFVHVNVATNKICNIHIDLIQTLTMDGFLQNTKELSEWYYRKYPLCLYNYKKNIVDEEKENVNNDDNNNNNKESRFHRMIHGDVDYDDKNKNKEKDIKRGKRSETQHNGDKNVDDDIKSKRFLKLTDDVNNVNEKRVSNDVRKMKAKKNVVFNNWINIRNDESHVLEERHLRSNVGRSLISVWDGIQTSGTYILSNDVKITKTVKVEDGKALEITGIVGVDGIRPAIDGGGTPGCKSNCHGNRVFYVEGSDTKLILTNLTIKNGYVCRYIYISLSDHFSIMVFFMYQSNY